MKICSIELMGEEAERHPVATGPWKAEQAHKVRLALNLAVDKQAILQRVLGGLGTVFGSWLTYPTDAWTTPWEYVTHAR